MNFEEIAQLEVEFATGGRNRGRVENVKKKWQYIWNRISKPLVTSETFDHYCNVLDDDARNELKNRNGYWIGGHCAGGIRSRNTVMDRWIVMFDVDDTTPAVMEAMLSGKNALGKLAYFIYTSRKHHPERPRFRVVIPLGRACPIDDYDALVRILAQKLDPEMATVDHISFRPAQMMYWPSVSKDAEPWYTAHYNPGTLLNPIAQLAKFDRDVGDHRDFDNLPIGAKEKNARRTEAKAEDPREKGGMIGAFCLEYTVPEAIAEFLPDVYLESDDYSNKPRYTYVHGSASNGAVVEDDGLFLYSHHGTDPCGGRLVNAYDMVRLHLFGDVDKKALAKDDAIDPEKDFGKLPSHKKMLALANARPEVVNRAAKLRYLDAAGGFDDLEGSGREVREPTVLPKKREPRPEPAEAAPGEFVIQGQLKGEKTPYDCESDATDMPRAGGDGPDAGGDEERPGELGGIGHPYLDERTYDMLPKGKGGTIIPSLDSVRMILENDTRFGPRLAFNELTHRTVIRSNLDFGNPSLGTIEVHDHTNGLPVIDVFDTQIRTCFTFRMRPFHGFGMKVPKTDMRDAIDAVAYKNRFHPVVEYLDSLEWDGVPRKDTVCMDWLGTPDTPYHREVFSLMLMGAVARAYEPGHKFDTAMVLEGPQGIRKSTFLEVLGKRKWFAEIKGDLGDQNKVVEQMAGCWIAELPEMAAWNRSEANDAKGFLSSRHDTTRLAYRAREETFPRRCVFFGTTNEETYLRDLTGNRRINPVRCMVTRIDTEGFEAIVDQLWAEAVVAYRQMRQEMPRSVITDLPLMLSPAAVEEAVEKQETAVDTGVAGDLYERLSAWANEPKRLQEFLSQKKALADFDDENNPNRKVELCRFNYRSAAIDGLGFDDNDMLDGRKMLALQNALKLLVKDGQWEKSRLKKERFYQRLTASFVDQKRGYRFIENTPDTGDLV